MNFENPFNPFKKNFELTKFDDVIPQQGETYTEAMIRVTKKRILNCFKYGFNPFEGGTVLDIGSRDGKFIEMIKELGAENVIPVEPDISDLNNEILQTLQKQNLYNDTIENLETEKNDIYDGAFVLNCSPEANPMTMVPSIARQIKDTGIVIFSFAEKNPTYDRFIPVIKKFFKNVRTNGDIYEIEDKPHKIIVIATKQDNPNM